ncbi:hypothetical protein Scep_024236 [Stephania cephalantha]|uniref:Uncharacterized protein n=1 Tax=Stephania cephalantha TaxID=152367 RepID=A0AAP0EW71_9MAGN
MERCLEGLTTPCIIKWLGLAGLNLLLKSRSKPTEPVVGESSIQLGLNDCVVAGGVESMSNFLKYIAETRSDLDNLYACFMSRVVQTQTRSVPEIDTPTLLAEAWPSNECHPSQLNFNQPSSNEHFESRAAVRVWTTGRGVRRWQCLRDRLTFRKGSCLVVQQLSVITLHYCELLHFKCTIFNQDVTLYDKILKVDYVYTMSNATVNIVDAESGLVPNEFQWILNRRTCVKKVTEAEKFKLIKEIKPTQLNELHQLIDSDISSVESLQIYSSDVRIPILTANFILELRITLD